MNGSLIRASATRRTLTAASALALLAMAGLAVPSGAVAGPLDPPGGAPASTYKTLGEVEPRTAVQSLPGDASGTYVISQSGSYYLTGNITGAAGKHGIKVMAPDVTIDLNGFSLIGGSQSPSAVFLGVSGLQYSLVIRNGSVLNWSSWAVDIGGSPAARLENLRIHHNGGGVRVGAHSVVQGCEVTNNTNVGLFAQDRAVITSCLFNGNTQSGVIVGEASTLTNCSSTFNTQAGFQAGAASTLQNCTAKSCNNGFVLGAGSTVTGCTATNSAQQGFTAPDGVTLAQCTARSCTGMGFDLGANSTMTACTASANLGGGAQVSSGANITGCTFGNNSVFGLKGLSSGNLIDRCTVINSVGDGIVINGFSAVTNCMLQGNTASGPAAGLRMAGTANHVESNIFNSNKVGIEAIQGGNLIVKNSFAFNPTRWALAAGNNAAQVIVTPGAGFTSTDPWANFAY